jgi:hypothetical protein
MLAPATRQHHRGLPAKPSTRRQLDALATAQDIPLHTLAA